MFRKTNWFREDLMYYIKKIPVNKNRAHSLATLVPRAQVTVKIICAPLTTCLIRTAACTD